MTVVHREITFSGGVEAQRVELADDGTVTTTVAGQQPTSANPTAASVGRAQTIAAAQRADLIPPSAVYIPRGWGSAAWYPALTASGSSLAKVAIVGDSISQGFDASTIANSWVGLLRSALQARYGDGGSGFVGVMWSKLMSTATATNYATLHDATVELSATGWTAYQNDTVQATGDGPGGCTIYANSSSRTATFKTVRGSKVSLWFERIGTSASPNTGGKIDWTIDGSAQTQIDTAGAVAASTPEAATVTGLSTGTHTVVATTNVSAGTQYVNIAGCAGENTTGVVVHNYAKSGLRAAALATQGASAYGNMAAWSGGQSNQADLVVLAVGVNDARANIAADTYIASIRKALDQIKSLGSRNGAVDVLIVMMPVGKWENSGAGPGGSTVLYADYCLRMRGIAECYGAAFVNLWTVGRNNWDALNTVNYWSNGHSGTGNSGSDGVHPGDTGHRWIFDQLTAAVPVLG